MADMDWLNQFVQAVQDPNVGGGYGQLPTTATEIIKAGMKLVGDQTKLNDATNAAIGAIPNAPDQLPLAQTLAQTVAGGGSEMSGFDKFRAALDTQAGAGGFANLLGTLGSAVAAPGSWQDRVGKAGAGLGANAVAADAYSNLLNRLNPPAPAAPNSGQPGAANFPVAPLLLPPVLKLGQ